MELFQYAYRNNFGNNNYRPYPANNGYSNSYGNSYNSNRSVPSELEVMLKDFISTHTAFNKSVEENFGKIDVLASKVDSLALDVDLLKLKVIMFLQKLAKSPNASAINMDFTKHVANALMQVREEKLKHEVFIPRKLDDGWEPIIKTKVNDFDCNALCDLGASIFLSCPRKFMICLISHLRNSIFWMFFCSIMLCKNFWGELMMFISWLTITLSLLILLFWTSNAMHLVPLLREDLFLELLELSLI